MNRTIPLLHKSNDEPVKKGDQITIPWEDRRGMTENREATIVSFSPKYDQIKVRWATRFEDSKATAQYEAEFLGFYWENQPPTLAELEDLVKAVKGQISDDFRASDDPDDDKPGIQLTVAWNGRKGKPGWSYQTGDNSYTGGAYHYSIWGVTGVYRRSNSREVAQDLIAQLLDGDN